MTRGDYADVRNITINEEGIKKLLLKLNPNKACGPDGVSLRMLKQLAAEVAHFLPHIFQSSITTGAVRLERCKRHAHV